MGGKKEEGRNENSPSFDLNNELASYVNKNVIPSRVAEKLKEKINEKNVEINKKQLEQLVFKIQNVLNNYLANRKNDDKKTSVVDNDMKLLIDKIEKIDNRLGELENSLFDNVDIQDESNIVTTEDIKLPGKEEGRFNSVKLKPLRSIPDDPESVIVVMKWLQFLVDKCGRDNLPEVLDYYVDIGWMTDDAKIDVLDYSNGITEEVKEKKNNMPELPPKDHIQSFVFIQRLNGNKFDKHFIEKVDGEISRLTKKFNNYKFK